jgi:uncharacterized membrane protein YeaQ/YmgE (transglycosylase-associated protein family)
MELVFILVYGSILGLMAPYLLTRNESYGALLAPAIALVYGFVAWTICTWAGLSYSDYWIWTITMLGMPAAMILGIRFLANSRVKHETA